RWTVRCPRMGRETESRARLAHEALAHSDALYNFAFHLTRNPAEAEDLVQETFARALASADPQSVGASLKAWLFRTLRNAFIDLYRRQRRIEGGLETVGDEQQA